MITALPSPAEDRPTEAQRASWDALWRRLLAAPPIAEDEQPHDEMERAEDRR